MKHRDKVAAVLVGAAGLALMSTGTAYAFWTTGGAGTGTSNVGVETPLTAAAATITGQLFPAGPSLTGEVQVTNPNSFPVKITGIDFAATSTTDADCSNTGVTFADASDLTVIVPAGESRPVDYTVSMDTTSSNGCQNAPFTATFTLQAVSQ